MPITKTFRRSGSRRVLVLHASTHDSRPVCKTKPGPFIRLTRDRALVTCRHCQAKAQAVHYALADGLPCCHRAGGARLCLTLDPEDTTCHNCLRILGRRILRRTGQNHAGSFPTVYRHYGLYSAPCGTTEPGFARSLDWPVVDCPVCLALRDLAPSPEQWERQVALLNGCAQSSWEFAGHWPEINGGKVGDRKKVRALLDAQEFAE